MRNKTYIPPVTMEPPVKTELPSIHALGLLEPRTDMARRPSQATSVASDDSGVGLDWIEVAVERGLPSHERKLAAEQIKHYVNTIGYSSYTPSAPPSPSTVLERLTLVNNHLHPYDDATGHSPNASSSAPPSPPTRFTPYPATATTINTDDRAPLAGKRSSKRNVKALPKPHSQTIRGNKHSKTADPAKEAKARKEQANRKRHQIELVKIQDLLVKIWPELADQTKEGCWTPLNAHNRKMAGGIDWKKEEILFTAYEKLLALYNFVQQQLSIIGQLERELEAKNHELKTRDREIETRDRKLENMNCEMNRMQGYLRSIGHGHAA